MRRKVGVALIAVAALVAGWFVMRKGPEDHLAALVAELRARGEPVTYEDLMRPLPPDAENGAHELDRGFQWLADRLARADAEVDDYSFRTHYAGPWRSTDDEPWFASASPERLDDLREFLDTMGPFYEHLAAAAAEPEIAWPLDPKCDLPNLHSAGFWRAWRSAREVLEARLFAAEPHDARLATMSWILAIPRRVRRLTHGDTVRLAQRRWLGCATLRDAVEAGRIDPVDGRAALEPLLVGPGLETMPTIVRAVRVDEIVSFPQLLDGSLQRKFNADSRYIQQAFGAPKPSATERIANGVQDALAGVTFDWRARLAALRDVDSMLPTDDVWDPEADRAVATFELRHGEFASRASGCLRAAVAAESLARVALAAYAFHAEHGTWPEKTADLAPLFPNGVPIDPFTGAAFEIEREGAAIVLRADVPTGTVRESVRDAGLEWRLAPR